MHLDPLLDYDRHTQQEALGPMRPDIRRLRWKNIWYHILMKSKLIYISH